MHRFGRICRTAVAAGLVVVFCFGVAALFTEAEAKGPCRCPMIYAPVECDHGKIFANQCLADCRNAKNCVPIGLL